MTNSFSQGKVWRAAASVRKLEDLPSGIDGFYKNMGGFFLRQVPRRTLLMKRAANILKLEKHFSTLNNAELQLRADSFREIFLLGREKESDIDMAFAYVREVAWRVKKMKPYQVQVAGGLAIEKGYIAEMSTGEGKTLTATMPAVLAGWRGRGCHVMTTNNYLACRDAEEMAPIYEFCGLTVTGIEDSLPPEKRPAAYQADITYCTNKDVAADFLRDQLSCGHGAGGTMSLLANISHVKQKENMTTLRGLECAIVDEADSVLIDDGVTPLLISGESDNAELHDAYTQAAYLAKLFLEDEHYTANHRFREITLTKKGKALLNEEAPKFGGLWMGQVRRQELLVQALVARHFFILNKQYIIDDGKIVIVDESTGRLMPDRFWREGMHQAVEAKEGVEVNPGKETYARISFQKFFRLYKKLSGMSGTASEAKSEFFYFYQRQVVGIPTHRKCIRKMYGDKIFLSEEAKFKALIKEVEEKHKTGRAVLVGTGSIKDSETVSELLTEASLEHEVLNARYHEQEAEIVKRAGITGKITVATNMAGRGTDIKLSEATKKAGGLHVIATEHFDSSRIDRQLYGRASRQGDPGSAISLISLSDPLIIKNLGFIGKLCSWSLRPLGQRVRIPGAILIFKLAQYFSVKQGRRQRKGVLKSDKWLESNLGFAGKEHD